MTNVAIYEKGSDTITMFVVGCVKTGRDFRGTSGSITGVKEAVFDHLWTQDVATYDPATESWDTLVSELTPCDPGAQVSRTSRADYEAAVVRRGELADMTYSQLDTYIDNNVTDLASARAYLSHLSKVVLGMIKMMDMEHTQ